MDLTEFRPVNSLSSCVGGRGSRTMGVKDWRGRKKGQIVPVADRPSTAGEPPRKKAARAAIASITDRPYTAGELLRKQRAKAPIVSFAARPSTAGDPLACEAEARGVAPFILAPERPRTALPTINVLAAGDLKQGLLGLDAVLFLDVDGVLHHPNPRHAHQRFRKPLMANLREVVARSAATIVLSTAWRLRKEHRAYLAAKLSEFGMRFESRTPAIDPWDRPREISAWLQKFRPKRWVAVDDMPLSKQSPRTMGGHFVKTRPHLGLDRQAAARIMALFDEQQRVAGAVPDVAVL